MRVDDILRRKGLRTGTVGPDETVAAALRLLAAEDTDALLVTDVGQGEGGPAVGVLSERDVVRGLRERGAAVLEQPVAALMRRDPVCCRPGDSVRRVRQLMDEHKVRHIPVLEGAALVGIITDHDLIKTPAMEARAYSIETWDFPVAAHQ